MYTVRHTNHTRAFQIVHICDHSTECAHTVANPRGDHIRLGRAVDNHLVERRHRSRHVVDERRLLAAPLVEQPLFSDEFSEESRKKRSGDAPLPLHIHKGLHPMRRCETAVIRNKAAREFCHTGNMQFLRTDKAPLCHGDHALGAADEIIHRHLVSRIVLDGVHDVVCIGQNPRRNRKDLDLSHSFVLLPVRAQHPQAWRFLPL